MTTDSKPPSGDAPDLREAKRLLQGQFAYAINPEGYYPGDFTTDYDDIIDRALALAASAPSSPATPAPLEVERLARALPDWMVEHSVHQTEEELRRIIARNIMRDYLEQP